MTRSAPSILLLLLSLIPATGGCFLIKSPDKANVALRKENQQLETRVGELQRKSEGDVAMIRSLEDRAGTLQTLPRERLERLFTTHAIQLGRLTGGADLDPAMPGHEGLRVYLMPLDQTGDQLKAAGAITVEAFDLSRGAGAKVGTWAFDALAARETWTSVLNRYNYVLTCPWQEQPPAGTQLHLVVTFVDELTQGKFTKSVDVPVQPPPAGASTGPTAPAAPATAPTGRAN